MLRLIHQSERLGRLVLSDTKKLPRIKRLIDHVDLPEGVNLNDFALQHWPSQDKIPRNYEVAVQESYRFESENGRKIKVPVVYYVAVRR